MLYEVITGEKGRIGGAGGVAASEQRRVGPLGDRELAVRLGKSEERVVAART